MGEERTIHDPFLGKDVQISSNLTDRLRGKYANGPTMPNGEPEFGWREFQTPPIQHQAADRIDALVKALEECRTSHCGYAITKNEQYPIVLADFWKEIKRIDGIARAALASVKTSGESK